MKKRSLLVIVIVLAVGWVAYKLAQPTAPKTQDVNTATQPPAAVPSATPPQAAEVVRPEVAPSVAPIKPTKGTETPSKNSGGKIDSQKKLELLRKQSVFKAEGSQ